MALYKEITKYNRCDFMREFDIFTSHVMWQSDCEPAASTRQKLHRP